MKAPFRIIALVVPAVLVCVASVSAQQQLASGYVTVLDVARVFKSYAPFDNQLKQIEAEAENLRGNLVAQQQQLQSDVAQVLQQYKQGTPERNQQETLLEQRKVTMMTKARQAQEELLNREARLYYETYAEMQKVVSQYCQQSNISLVIRFESEPINRESRPEVIKGVNRNIVYQNNSDITDAIIQNMNQAAGVRSSQFK